MNRQLDTGIICPRCPVRTRNVSIRSTRRPDHVGVVARLSRPRVREPAWHLTETPGIAPSHRNIKWVLRRYRKVAGTERQHENYAGGKRTAAALTLQPSSPFEPPRQMPSRPSACCALARRTRCIESSVLAYCSDCCERTRIGSLPCFRRPLVAPRTTALSLSSGPSSEHLLSSILGLKSSPMTTRGLLWVYLRRPTSTVMISRTGNLSAHTRVVHAETDLRDRILRGHKARLVQERPRGKNLLDSVVLRAADASCSARSRCIILLV